MVQLIVSSLSILKNWLVKHKRLSIELILAALTAFCVWYGATLHNRNKALSKSLETAYNNIESYQNIIKGSQETNNILMLKADQLQNSNDKLLQQIDSVTKQNKIKALNTAATQTQTLYVKDSKGVRGSNTLIEILKDTTYTDSIEYNKLTKVHYTIGKDTVNIGLDIKNTQYLLIYKKKEYKNKKNFFKRLFTFDFKKTTKCEYRIQNTNDLINTTDVRIVEIIQ